MLEEGGTTHGIALDPACELQLDVLLIQEPWWRGHTKALPYFNVHIPHNGISIRPRAITYTRKNAKQIQAIQKFPSATPISDYCWVEVNNTTFLNV